MLPKFNEYINSRGKVVAKPKTEKIADYDGPNPVSPQKPVTKGKNWDSMAASPKENPGPYRAPGKDKGQQKPESGLGDKGDKKLVYNPKVEGFLRETKNLSSSEFAKYMLETCGCGGMTEDIPGVTAYTSGKIHPHPPEAIKYIVYLSNKNDSVLNNMIHEMKETGCLSKLIKSLLDYPEAYDELSNLFGDDEEGPKRCGCLARAMDSSYNKFIDDQESMYESVGPPFGIDDENDKSDDVFNNEEDDEEDDMDSDDDFDMDDEDSEDSDFDMDDEDDMDSDADFDMDDEDSEDSDFDMDDKSMHKRPSKPRKLKKKFAHDNLLSAMSNHNSIKDAMKKYMSGF